MLDQDTFNQLWPKACEILKLLRVPDDVFTTTHDWRFNLKPYTKPTEDALVFYAFTNGFNKPPQELRLWCSSDPRGVFDSRIFIEVMCEKFKKPDHQGWTHAHLQISVRKLKTEGLRDGSIRFEIPYNPAEGTMHKLLAAGYFSPMMCRAISCLFDAKPPKKEVEISGM